MMVYPGVYRVWYTRVVCFLPYPGRQGGLCASLPGLTLIVITLEGRAKCPVPRLLARPP